MERRTMVLIKPQNKIDKYVVRENVFDVVPPPPPKRKIRLRNISNLGRSDSAKFALVTQQNSLRDAGPLVKTKKKFIPEKN